MSEKFTYQYDHSTGSEVVRPASEEELILIANGAKDKEKREKQQALELAKRESGKAKLLALGLNQDEINIFLLLST